MTDQQLHCVFVYPLGFGCFLQETGAAGADLETFPRAALPWVSSHLEIKSPASCLVGSRLQTAAGSRPLLPDKYPTPKRRGVKSFQILDFFLFQREKKKNSYQLTAFEHFTAQLSHWEVPRQPVNNRFVIKFVFFIRARQKITGQRDYRLLWWSSNKVMPAMVMCQRDSDRAAFGTITLTELTWNDSSWKQRTLYFNRCLY